MLLTKFKRGARAWTGLALLALVLSSFSTPAFSAMVSTQTLVQTESERAVVSDFLQREDVRAQLQALGVSPEAAAARAAALSDAEAAQLAGQIGDLPAGGTNILGVAVLIFLILLLTDILGFTDIFPFVKKTAR
ncbi:MAG: hypothetical protein AMJ69_07695 [Gammaproteobacteria bacterium SG8_47]|nr:MAG: hypothetical protein AMJ69_07695 [Gammaproteobacteria bacterium SG8_47]